MGRYSISGLMGYVVASALALAALRSSGELWAGLLSLLTIGLIGVAILHVIHRRGLSRARWIGFLAFAGGYLLLGSGPWSSPGGDSRVPTTRLLVHAHSLIAAATGPTAARALLVAERESIAGRLQYIRKIARDMGDPALARYREQLADIDGQLAAIPPPVSRWLARLPGAADRDRFVRVGHDLLALLAGWLGAVISWRVRRDSDRAALASDA